MFMWLSTLVTSQKKVCKRPETWLVHASLCWSKETSDWLLECPGGPIMMSSDLPVTSSQQDTHVNHSQPPGCVKARKMTATSGRTSYKSLHKKDPLGAFSKMFMVWQSFRPYNMKFILLFMSQNRIQLTLFHMFMLKCTWIGNSK